MGTEITVLKIDVSDGRFVAQGFMQRALFPLLCPLLGPLLA